MSISNEKEKVNTIMIDVATMKTLAEFKMIQANGSYELLREIEANLDTIACAGEMAPINENLLGFSYMLLAEVKRLTRK